MFFLQNKLLDLARSHGTRQFIHCNHIFGNLEFPQSFSQKIPQFLEAKLISRAKLDNGLTDLTPFGIRHPDNGDTGYGRMGFNGPFNLGRINIRPPLK